MGISVVGPDGNGSRALAIDFGCQLLGFRRRSSIGERDRRTIGREPTNDLRADTARPTGHKCSPT